MALFLQKIRNFIILLINLFIILKAMHMSSLSRKIPDGNHMALVMKSPLFAQSMVIRKQKSPIVLGGNIFLNIVHIQGIPWSDKIVLHKEIEKTVYTPLCICDFKSFFVDKQIIFIQKRVRKVIAGANPVSCSILTESPNDSIDRIFIRRAVIR